MKKIALMTVWSGKLPPYFLMWLKSCAYNSTIDFFVMTDDKTEFDCPLNVKIVHFSFQELKERFQKLFPFEISLNRAYKICDYKPAYGEAFADYLHEYDFWGYCDMDLIWGNMREFLTDEILESYDRIFTRGHCSLFRNTKEVNAYYRTLPDNGHLNYKKVFQSEENWCFDEWAAHCGGGISVIFKENGIKTYDEPSMADIYIEKAKFQINRRTDLRKMDYFYFENGNLYACGKKMDVPQVPVLYCHFQKRKLEIQEDTDFEKFYFYPPNQIVDAKKARNLLLEKIKIVRFDFIWFLKRVYRKIRR